MLVEAEIWPNFLWRARDLGMPVFLVNARLSDRSYRGYKRFGFLFRPLVRRFGGRRRAKRGGCRQAARAGLPAGSDSHCRQPEIRRRQARRAPVAGCPGPAAPARREAGRAGCSWRAARMRARKRFWPSNSCGCGSGFRTCSWCWCRAISSAAGRWAASWRRAGVKFAYRSEIIGQHAACAGRSRLPARQHDRRTEILLRARHGYFRRQEPDGGRRPEPDRAGRAGQGDGLWSEHAELRGGGPAASWRQNGAVQVRDAAELEKVLGELLADEARREQLGRNALKVVRENLGAIERTVDMIVEHLDGASDIYVANGPDAAVTHSPAAAEPRGDVARRRLAARRASSESGVLRRGRCP